MPEPTKIDFHHRRISQISDFTELIEMLFPGNKNQQYAAACIIFELKWADRIPAKSMALHYSILNTEVNCLTQQSQSLPGTIKCDLSKIEKCEFMNWCRMSPTEVSEPLWFAMITNLACLNGGQELIHEISRLDSSRYDYWQTQRLIKRVTNRGYRPVSCTKISTLGFYCWKLGRCQAKAPMYLTHKFSIWKK